MSALGRKRPSAYLRVRYQSSHTKVTIGVVTNAIHVPQITTAPNCELLLVEGSRLPAYTYVPHSMRSEKTVPASKNRKHV